MREMGIEVWRIRTQAPVLTSAEESSASVASGGEEGISASLALLGEAAPDQAVARKPAPVDVEQPTFLFCFLDYDSLSLIFSLDVSHDTLPPNIRQFADDVNFALNPGKRRIPKIRDLRWPIVRASHIVQTEAEARTVVAQKLAQCCANVVVFGSLAAAYTTNPARDEQAGELLVVREVEHYFSEPAAKQDLWAQLKSLRSGIRQ